MVAVAATGVADLLDFNKPPFWPMLRSKIALHGYLVEALGAGLRTAIRWRMGWGA